MSGITPKKRKMRRIGDTKKTNGSKLLKKKSNQKQERKTPSYTYQIVLTNRGKLVKSFKKLKDRNKLINMYHKTISSNKVIFPIKYSVLDELVDSDYKLLFLKEIKDSDEVETEPNKIFIDYKLNKWKVVKSESYQMEETFRVFGLDERKNINEIKQYLISKKTYNRELGIIGNKVLIFNEDVFDMILTKCPEDAKRLGIFLYNYIDDYKLFFLRGEYQGGDKPEIIDKIEYYTGWSRKKINRIKKS